MTDYLQLLVTTLYQINFIEPNAYQRFIDIDVVIIVLGTLYFTD